MLVFKLHDYDKSLKLALTSLVLFQDMDSGDSIMISAKVVACVDEIDCAPVSMIIFKLSSSERPI